MPLKLRPLFIALCLSPGLVLAWKHVPIDFEPGQFEAQRAKIEAGMRGEQYREISTENRSKVVAALDRIGDAFADASSEAELAPEVRASVAADEALVNETLAEAAADSRMICRRERRVGSNMPTNVCKTAAERRRMSTFDVAASGVQ